MLVDKSAQYISPKKSLRACHRELPHYLQLTHFLPKSEIHNYDTRGKITIYVIRTKTKIIENSLRHKIPTVVNMTPPCIPQKLILKVTRAFLYILIIYNIYNIIYNI